MILCPLGMRRKEDLPELLRGHDRGISAHSVSMETSLTMVLPSTLGSRGSALNTGAEYCGVFAGHVVPYSLGVAWVVEPTRAAM